MEDKIYHLEEYASGIKDRNLRKTIINTNDDFMTIYRLRAAEAVFSVFTMQKWEEHVEEIARDTVTLCCQ